MPSEVAFALRDLSDPSTLPGAASHAVVIGAIAWLAGRTVRLAVHRALEGPSPRAEVRVLDRGSGVPRGSEEKIFEKFYRAHDSLSSGIEGSGLGLTLARQIARAHGGDVLYEPREGGGSCFSLRMPLTAPPP